MHEHDIDEQRTFRLLPSADIGFSKPALEFERADGSRGTRLASSFDAPAPELARAPGDPGWWRVTVWLPVGAAPVALVPDPSAPTL